MMPYGNFKAGKEGLDRQANKFREIIYLPTSFNLIDPGNFMKQTQKLITLVLLALALNAAGKTVEAKNLPVSKPGKTEQTNNTAPNKELYTVTAISFSGLESLSEQELMTSLPLKIKDKITIPGTELSGALQYLWKLQLFSDIKVEKSDLGQNNIALKFMVKELPVLERDRV